MPSPQALAAEKERVAKEVQLLTVTRQQYAVILDPVENGKQQLGRKKVITNTSLKAFVENFTNGTA